MREGPRSNTSRPRPRVLVSAAISRGPSHRLLVLWVRDGFEIVVSRRLLHELETVLLRRKFRAKLTYEQVLEYVLWLRDRGILADEGDQFPAFTADPDDDYLVALTLARLGRRSSAGAGRRRPAERCSTSKVLGDTS